MLNKRVNSCIYPATYPSHACFIKVNIKYLTSFLYILHSLSHIFLSPSLFLFKTANTKSFCYIPHSPRLCQILFLFISFQIVSSVKMKMKIFYTNIIILYSNNFHYSFFVPPIFFLKVCTNNHIISLCSLVILCPGKGDFRYFDL